jgi:cellobiose phosphorylase
MLSIRNVIRPRGRVRSPADALEPPPSTEIFSAAQLDEHAASLALRHRLLSPRARRKSRLLQRLSANAASLRQAHEFLTEVALAGTRVTPAAEWFIDNYHVIEEQIRTAKRHLPRTYDRELPRLAGGSLAGTPRVHDIVVELISHSGGQVDVERLRTFIVAYQRVTPLRLGELWAIPIMLRLALIDNVRRVIDAVTAGRRDRQSARAWADRLVEAATSAPSRVISVLAELVDGAPELTDSFVAELSTRLQGRGPSLMFPVAWLEQRVVERGQTIERIFQLVSQSQAAHQVSIGNSINSLRLLGATDWRPFVEGLSVVDQELRADPAGVYASMDFATRDRYRRVVERLSKRSSMAEWDVARTSVELSRSAVARGAVPRVPSTETERAAHVGYFLIDEGTPRLERAVEMRPSVTSALANTRPGARFGAYAVTLAAATIAATSWVVAVAPPVRTHVLACAAVVGALLLVTSQVVVTVLNWLVTQFAQPHVLPRLDFEAGIPQDHETAVVVPTMLTDAAEVDALLQSLEVRFLANRQSNLFFVLLSDFRDGPKETMPNDRQLLERAVAGIRELNARHGTGSAADPAQDPFFLLHRPRRFNAGEGVWMGWERKRGKLEELNGALRGDTRAFTEIVGDTERLRGVKYVIVLDSDTELPRDAARQMVATTAHWLNRPIYDRERGRVVQGYSILQPRVDVTMTSASQSPFARLYAGEAGIDPYTRAVSDVYQDLFAEGSFIGKGIYDVEAFSTALAGRLPENRILSHDLLEGAYARSGLMSDVTLLEDQPSTYAADMSRRLRWIRGDWQIASWLGWRVPGGGPGSKPARNPISALSRWKILDNLRRSLVAPATLTLLVASWTLPGAAAFGAAVVLAALFLPPVLSAAVAAIRRPREVPFGRHGKDVLAMLGRQLLREAFALVCLPFEAASSAGAIVRTGARVLFSKRHLLEWRTARDAQRARTSFRGTYHAMMSAPVLGLAIAAVTIVTRGPLPAAAVPVILAWLLAPALAWWASRTAAPRPAVLTAADRSFLRKLARRTWSFFEVFVAEADNHLPPDNFQEDPPRGIASRTSPTNIGLALTANLAAYDLGYLAVGAVVERVTSTLDTLERLPRHRGHLYNWYDTRSLEPLRPMYVSTVDSGNLAGHLFTLAAGLTELIDRPAFPLELMDGVRDTLEVLEDVCHPTLDEDAAPLAVIRGHLAALPDTLPACRRTLNAVLDDLTVWEVRRQGRPRQSDDAKVWLQALRAQCEAGLRELSWIAPWTEVVAPWPAGAGGFEPRARLEAGLSLVETARLADTAGPGWPEAWRVALSQAAARAAQRIDTLRALAHRCERLADLDYDFLYDRNRRLLSIGFNVHDNRLDASFYDLLASEARLTSFVAIAGGKLPQEHWFSLGRQVTASSTGGRPVLLSWSGSMFEYLMPLLVMPTYERTLLDETYRGVVTRQMAYGAERGVPWGISESGYNKTDAQLNYQYRAFGVPGLGFKRGLRDDLVVAPYATVMALMVDPPAACANLRALAKAGFQGAFGFYEAIDYTADRVPRGKSFVPVRSFMSHHQGMALLALDGVLRDRPMQRRFEARPDFQATTLLLQEKTPRVAPVEPNRGESAGTVAGEGPTEGSLRVFTTPNTPSPEVHLLSNGRYHVAVSNAGGGYSRWNDLAITRWREDPTRDHWGQFIYVRDVSGGAFWSATHQPTLRRAAGYEAIFSQGRAEFRRRDGDVQSHLEIGVSPEDDVEVRRLMLTNRGQAPKTLEVTTFGELVLAPPEADAAHPAFSNLFVETELLPQRQAILATRRPRSAHETPPWAIHLVTIEGDGAAPPSYETDRAEFLGRGRSPIDPQAMHRAALSSGAGAVLDPVMSIRCSVTLAPGATARIHAVTGVGATRATAEALIEKYSDHHAGDRVFDLSWTHSQVELRRLDIDEAASQLYGRMAGRIIYASRENRAPASVLARNRGGQSSLWAYGISGDLPIVLLRISDQSNLEAVKQLLKAHAYWRLKGLKTDLVIWNEDSSVYRQALHDELMSAVGATSEGGPLERPGGIFVRRAEQVSEEDRVLMQTVARLVIVDSDGPLSEQLNRQAHAELPGRLVPVRPVVPAPPAPAPLDQGNVLTFFNGLGGFSRDGREYVITTAPDRRTPAPWVNVLANPWFGSVVSESGSAYTWCENANTYRLSPWSNDPVSDGSGECLYVRDDDTGGYWSPTPLPASGRTPYVTRHGFGYTDFEHAEDGLRTDLRTFVAVDAPIKFFTLRVRNVSDRARRISITAVCDVVLGSSRSVNAPYVVTELEPTTGALLARNAYSSELPARVAFLDCSETQRTVTGDRAEVLGRNGTSAAPACLERQRLSGRIGPGFDPCLALQVPLALAPGQEREVVVTFGSGRDQADARTLLHRFRGVGAARAAFAEVEDHWSQTLGGVSVKTPDPALDVLANGWLLYQVLSARMWGRSGFYQSGGAFGFRDQLQDAMALVHSQPALLRDQILRSAARQFREGDVQHWWHPPSGRGVRTRISDDYLWLPYAVCRYVSVQGDTGVLAESVPFLEGRLVNAEEDSYYDLPARSQETATLYEHCVRAIRHGLSFGRHGLPLMGSGDWNDGMNLVGDGGAGESVWLAFFLHDVLSRFVDVARMRDDLAFASECRAAADSLRENIDRHGWDGAWYRRAYFDDGTPLGSATNVECQIDSLPQSWSVLTGVASPDRARMALEAVHRRLVRPSLRVVQLFDPPFDRSDLKPGYVKGYVPGVRENGGQYTHAAIWAAMAFAAHGDGDRAWKLFGMLNPIRHGDSPEAIASYRVEPYVVAADVYTNPRHAGRGGWTWYTGSAAWMYRLIVESLLGLRREVDRLLVAPLLPEGWNEVRITYRYYQTTYAIVVRDAGGSAPRTVRSVSCDGIIQRDDAIHLTNDGREHVVEIEMGGAAARAGVA